MTEDPSLFLQRLKKYGRLKAEEISYLPVKNLASYLSKNLLLLLVMGFLTLDVMLALELLPRVIANFFQSDPIALPVVCIAELLIVTLAAQFTYISPIRGIKSEIARFIAGSPSGGFIGRSNTNPDIEFIRIFFSKSLEILRNFKEEFQAGRVLKSEVELASDIQRNILKKTSTRLASLDVVADTKSATEVGWDSYDIIDQDENCFIYLGDVTGHGVASGFVMIMVNALVSGFSKMLTSGADILAKTNEILKPRIRSNMLMTLLMVRWNEKEKKLFMTGAGHEYLMVYKKKQDAVFKVQSGGVALGMTRNIANKLKELQITFEPGDVLVMYTDGITEARNGTKESDLMFGVERLMQTIKGAEKKTAHGIFNHITVELSKFMGYGHRQFDDITLVVVKYREEGEELTESDTVIPKEFITEWSWS